MERRFEGIQVRLGSTLVSSRMNRMVKTGPLTQVSHHYRTYMPDKARIREEHGDDEREKQRRRPGGYFIGPDTAKYWVSARANQKKKNKT